MSITKIMNIFRHALLMVKLNRKSYLLLSVTIAISLGILFEFLLFFDTRSFNNNKEAIRYPDNIGELREEGNQVSEVNRFCIQIGNMQNTAIEEWKQAILRLPSYEGNAGNKVIYANTFLTSRNFFNYPVFKDKFEKVELLEGRLFTQKEITDKDQVVVIDSALASALDKKDALHKFIKLPVKNESGNFHLEDYRIIGIVSKREDTITMTKDNDVELYLVDIYLPISQSSVIFSEDKIMNTYTIISKQLEEITRQALTSGVHMNSTYSYRKLMYEEMQDNTITKAVILIIIVVILEINMFSALSNIIKDRQKEIGIKRAIGIANRDIMLQFLIEIFVILICNVFVVTALCTSLSYIVVLITNQFYNVSNLLYIQPYSLILYTIISLSLILGNSLLTSYLTMKIDIIQNIKAE